MDILRLQMVKHPADRGGYTEGRLALVAHPTGLAAVACVATRLSAAGTESVVRTLHAMARHSATPAVLQEVQAPSGAEKWQEKNID
uniref:Uncharacterized protein n=1 Tax=Oryza punctata TaxID=4537 RepID=A0A0E0MBR4_ORYPU